MRENLIKAICAGNIDKARELIAQGADVNQADSFGNKPIEFAIKYSNNLQSRVAIKCAKTEEAKQALIAQLQSRSLEMVKLLLEKGAAFEIVRSQQLQSTILHRALEVFMEDDLVNVPLVRYLVLEKKMDVNAKNKPSQETPLHLATRAGNVEAMNILLDNGAKVDAVTITNETPLHSAAWKGNLEAVKLLVSKGANVFEQFHHFRFEGWKTALEVVPEGEQHNELRNFLKAQQTTKAYLWDCIKNPTSHKFVSAGVLATAGACLYGAWKCLSPESQKYISGIVSVVCIATYIIKQVKDYFYPSGVASR